MIYYTNYDMHTIDGQTVTLKMLLSEADVHDRNGKRQEAANIRAWVADVLSEQSKIVRSVWRRLPMKLTVEPKGIA